MEKIAFRMQLKTGCLADYRRRHDEIWPELVEALKAAGIRDYSIHHDAATDALFAVLWRDDPHGMDDLPSLPVMRRWWDWMAPLMETEADGAPVVWPLETVFHLD
ncbi:L-rhamnose mutarotase [Sphingomonas abietis]|uniref:L-rhamnose mutarotase n=1 Tax=Sphingomonas abietis TaxID=3012344 RepID=A0ABY7NK73_9SPHN|nr:L-rhamnose mutarotase [Sphingomonas abietis]WBO21942.1 L-rhamnose mutarotase [Sphingomonas abietis]